MKSTLSNFSSSQFPNLKKNVLALFLLLLFLGVQSFSLFAQSGSSITCPADIVQDNDPNMCSAVVTFPANNDIIAPAYTVTYSYNSGASFPVGTTKVTKQLLDQNGTPVSTCSFNVTVLDKDAPVISNCPGDISVNNMKDSCGAVVTYTAPTVYDRCTLQHKTFYYTGAPVTFIVPAGVTSIDVDATGAEGGHTFYNNSVYGFPGLGGEVYATIPVTPGEVLSINVGGAGQDGSFSAAGSGGFNGGGNGTASLDENNAVTFAAGGGGGASDIRTGGNSLAERIVVVGGGGAAGVTQKGGDGGDLTGESAAHGNSSSTAGSVSATGGTQTEGGKGGSYENGYYAGNGDLGIGGNGAAELTGGGGGAGLYGGGGGSFGAGAGGSSFTATNASDVYHIQGAQEGNGYVSLSYNQPPAIAQTVGLPSGSMFPVGETINTYTATDASGNTSTCTFKVTVTDNQKPLITAPSNVSVSSDNSSCAATNVALGTPVTSDNCAVANVTNDAPASFPVGTTTINYTVTDIHGNTAVATQTVTVTDNQKPLITAPANVSVSSDNNNCAATNVALGTPVTSDNCAVASVTNDAPASFPVGTTTINYTVTDIHGNTAVATQTVTVTDNQKPVLTVPAAQTFATVASSYAIPALVATDNCGIASVTYSVTGATVRSGTGTDASGSFNTGTSVITYTVTDIHGNVQIGSTTVNVIASPSLNVTIPDVYAVSPGGKPNTIYIGYGPSYITLKAVVTNGKAPYTYEWTINGYKIVISRYQTLPVFLPGEYTVTVTDANGATGTYTQKVQMVDVRCGNNNDKVIVCTTGKGNKKHSSECVNENKVDGLLRSGASLGECTSTTSGARIASPVSPEVVVETTSKFGVYPNPTTGQFTVQLTNFKASKAEVLVLSQNGMTVQRKTVDLTGANQMIVFNIGTLADGVYLVKVVSDEGIKTAKVILQH